MNAETMTWDPAKGPSDSQVDDAMRVLRADYWASIRGMVRDVADQIKAGDLADAEAVDEYIHETADGSYWTIYTHANYRAIMCSDHDPTEDLEEYGGMDRDYSKLLPLLAFFCVKHDVSQQLEAELGESVYDYFQHKDDEASDDE